MTDKIVVFSTCETPEQAGQIAHHLLEQHLAACVNILPGARSIYRWKGKVEDAQDCVLIIKTRRDVFPKLLTELAKVHPNEVPEVIALPVVDGAESYLAWIDREVAAREKTGTSL